MTGRGTLDFYAREAETYAALYGVSAELAPFLGRLPVGGRILELGCGGGHDSKAMLDAGFDVTATDGSPELARQAEKLIGRPVAVLLFADIDFDAAFDGIWANACLLHVPKPELPDIFGKIHRALRPGGVLFASFKTGGEEGLDRFGRYYNYPDEGFVRRALVEARWRTIEIGTKRADGYYNIPADWLLVTAVKA